MNQTALGIIRETWSFSIGSWQRAVPPVSRMLARRDTPGVIIRHSDLPWEWVLKARNALRRVCAGQCKRKPTRKLSAEGRFPIAQFARGISASNLPMIPL